MKNTFIQKISNYYTSSDCVQMMVPYLDGLTIISKDGIMYHHIEKSTTYINKYLEDDRRLQFPYSNIPFHVELKHMQKLKCVNQLYNYNTPYLIIGEGYGFSMEAYAEKDDDNTYLVQHILNENTNNCIINRQKLEEKFSKIDNNKIYFLRPTGEIITNTKSFLQNEYELKKKAKEKAIKHFWNNKGLYNYDITEYDILAWIDNNLYNANISLLNSPIIKVVLNNDDMYVTLIKEVNYIKPNCYEVFQSDMPITYFNLNQLKSNKIIIKNSPKPKISKFLNPNIPKKEIIEAKKKVLKRK